MRSKRRSFHLWLLLALAAPLAICRGQILSLPFRSSDLTNSAETAMHANAWTQHLEYVEKCVADAAAGQPAGPAQTRWNRMLADETVALALAHSAFVRRFTSGTLNAFPERVDKGDGLLRWLMSSEEALRACLMTIEPSNRGDCVLERWAQLRQAETNNWEQGWSLALACALVFDQPLSFDSRITPEGSVDMVARYHFFRTSARRGRLKVDLSHMPPWDLVWVVDAPVPDSDLAWAQEHVKLGRAEWAKAYEMVAYRMDQATGGRQIHSSYTLEELLRVGGVCTERAHFAAMSAKAHGIPAVPLYGEGQRGRHAWFAYFASPKSWNMTAGRYGQDQYATGFTSEPRSRQSITEQTLALYTDVEKGGPRHLQATRLCWLGQVMLARQDIRQAIALFRAAVELYPRHVPAWEALLAALRKAATPKAEWKTTLQAFRRDFKDFPDMEVTADLLETEVLLDDASADEILRSLRSQSRRMKDKDRTDLVLQTLNRHVVLLQNADKTNAVMGVYQKALREFGEEVPALQALAGGYFAYAKSVHREAAALHDIDAACRRQISPPSQDPFRAMAQAQLAEMLAGFYEDAGQPEKAKKVRRTVERASR